MPPPAPLTPSAARLTPTHRPGLIPTKPPGLPDLRKINRPGAEVTSKVNFDDIRRTPSFHEKSKNGTAVTEYRDRGKPVEIDVKSNFGTRYQMNSSTPDTSPKPHDAHTPITRLPSLNLRY